MTVEILLHNRKHQLHPCGQGGAPTAPPNSMLGKSKYNVSEKLLAASSMPFRRSRGPFFTTLNWGVKGEVTHEICIYSPINLSISARNEIEIIDCLGISIDECITWSFWCVAIFPPSTVSSVSKRTTHAHPHRIEFEVLGVRSPLLPAFSFSHAPMSEASWTHAWTHACDFEGGSMKRRHKKLENHRRGRRILWEANVARYTSMTRSEVWSLRWHTYSRHSVAAQSPLSRHYSRH